MTQKFERVFEVRLADIDQNGHLHNTGYFDYAAHARFMFFQERGVDARWLARENIGIMLLSEQIEYRRETFFGQSLTVTFQLTGMTADMSRWRVFHTFLHEDGTVAATLSSYGAWVDTKRRKIVAPPQEAASLLEEIRSAECELIS
jgi:acyl-CoA thioester hydrolase